MLQGAMRRVVYIALYETIAIIIVSIGLQAMTDDGPMHSGVLAVITSAVATAVAVQAAVAVRRRRRLPACLLTRLAARR